MWWSAIQQTFVIYLLVLPAYRTHCPSGVSSRFDSEWRWIFVSSIDVTFFRLHAQPFPIIDFIVTFSTEKELVFKEIWNNEKGFPENKESGPIWWQDSEANKEFFYYFFNSQVKLMINHIYLYICSIPVVEINFATIARTFMRYYHYYLVRTSYI